MDWQVVAWRTASLVPPCLGQRRVSTLNGSSAYKYLYAARLEFCWAPPGFYALMRNRAHVGVDCPISCSTNSSTLEGPGRDVNWAKGHLRLLARQRAAWATL